MKDRLAQFLKLEQLTAVKFAEIMEVQPSSISHLLSGRNKPNFEFISRMLLRFPELNPEWIINGMGLVYKSNVIEVPSDVNLVNESAITNVINGSGNTNGGDMTMNLFENTPLTIHQDAVMSDITRENQMVTDVITSVVPDVEPESEVQSTVTSKSIARVILFYTDGSFEEYHN